MSRLNLQQIDALCDIIKQAWEAKDPNRNKIYNMTESEVKNLVEERLSRLNLSLNTYKFEVPWDNINDYKAVKLEEIPKCKKQFCYIRDIFHGENILGLSLDSQKPCMIAAKLDDIESEFLREKVTLRLHQLISRFQWHFT